jgi:hypothetical protein
MTQDPEVSPLQPVSPDRRCDCRDPQPADPFHADLKDVLNRHSKENGSNTPDFVLAEFLTQALDAFDYATRYRESTPTHPADLSGQATPAWVFDILDAMKSGAPLHFHGHRPPADVQRWCAANLEPVPVDE